MTIVVFNLMSSHKKISYDLLICMTAHVSVIIMVALCNRADMIFLPCDFCLLSFFFFFLAKSHRSEIGCLPYFHTWCGLNANLECMSEMCCTRLAENTGRKKIAICASSHNFVGLYLRN